MKYLVVLLFTFLSFQKVHAIAFDDCSGGAEWFDKKYEKIRERSEVRDVGSLIDSIKKAAEFNCPEEVFKRLEASASSFKTRGLRNHIKFMTSEAHRVSGFRDPEWEFSEIERARSELAVLGYPYIPPATKQSVIDLLRRRGRQKSTERKAKCTNVDNRRPPLVSLNEDGSIKRNNMRNQDSIGWCYAFTAADLISAEVGQNISAVDIANAYNNGTWSDFWNDNESEMNESEMEGGFTAEAANAALKRGLCLERQMPSDDHAFVKKSENLMSGLKAVEGLYDIYRERTSTKFRNHTRRKSGSNLAKARQQFQIDLNCGEIDTDWSALFPGLSINELMQILGEANSKNNFIDRLIEKSCKPRFKPATRLRYEDDSSFTSTNTLMSRMDDKLTNGKMLGIHFMASVLGDRLDSESCYHASLVVARRFNETSGSCEYLIRNSWGTGCYQYDDELDCSQGNIWLPEVYMRQTLDGIIYAE